MNAKINNIISTDRSKIYNAKVLNKRFFFIIISVLNNKKLSLINNQKWNIDEKA